MSCLNELTRYNNGNATTVTIRAKKHNSGKNKKISHVLCILLHTRLPETKIDVEFWWKQGAKAMLFRGKPISPLKNPKIIAIPQILRKKCGIAIHWCSQFELDTLAGWSGRMTLWWSMMLFPSLWVRKIVKSERSESKKLGGEENTPRRATAGKVLAFFEPHHLRQPDLEISRSRISTPVATPSSHRHQHHHQPHDISGIARHISCHPACQPFSDNARKKIPTVFTPSSSARWLSHGRASEVFQQASGPACHRRQHSFSLCASLLLVCNASQLFL